VTLELFLLETIPGGKFASPEKTSTGKLPQENPPHRKLPLFGKNHPHAKLSSQRESMTRNKNNEEKKIF